MAHAIPKNVERASPWTARDQLLPSGFKAEVWNTNTPCRCVLIPQTQLQQTTMASAEKPNTLRLREQDLTSKIAIITGASKGIGRAITINLASRGCAVLGTCSSPESVHLIDKIADEIQNLYQDSEHQTPKIRGVAADMSSSTCHEDIADTIEREFDGHVDICINNAAPRTMTGIGSLDAEHISSMCFANIQTPALIVDELVKRRLFRRDSRIVFVSSARARKVNSKTYVTFFPHRHGNANM